MFELHLTPTEADIIERAFAAAIEAGKLPDPNIDGDDVRMAGLRSRLCKALEDYRGGLWGTPKRRW